MNRKHSIKLSARSRCIMLVNRNVDKFSAGVRIFCFLCYLIGYFFFAAQLFLMLTSAAYNVVLIRIKILFNTGSLR